MANMMNFLLADAAARPAPQSDRVKIGAIAALMESGVLALIVGRVMGAAAARRASSQTQSALVQSDGPSKN